MNPIHGKREEPMPVSCVLFVVSLFCFTIYCNAPFFVPFVLFVVSLFSVFCFGCSPRPLLLCGECIQFFPGAPLCPWCLGGGSFNSLLFSAPPAVNRLIFAFEEGFQPRSWFFNPCPSNGPPLVHESPEGMLERMGSRRQNHCSFVPSGMMRHGCGVGQVNCFAFAG